MHKRFYVICLCLLFTCLMGNSTVSHGAPAYRVDVLEPGNAGGWEESLKSFDDEKTIAQSETVKMDIWLHDVPEPLITAGFWMEFDASGMSIISTEIYSEPWDAGMSQTVKDPRGPGSYMVTVGNLSTASPDSQDDIIVAQLLFQCTSSDDVTITLTTIPDFDTVVGGSAGVYDPAMTAHTIILYPTATDTVDCDDGIACTVDSSGPDGQCLNIPDETLCDDGLYCNGTETCDPLSGCQAGSDPCNTREECAEETGECISLDEPSLSFMIIPQRHLQSHWFPLPLFMFIRSEDDETGFDTTTNVQFADGGILTPPQTMVLSENLIYVFSLIRPAGFGARGITEVETTVTTGEGSNTETLQIITLPFF